MQPTQLSYLEDSYRFQMTASFVDLCTMEDGKIALILDATLFYPQGGGQPYDMGFIESENGVFEVREVRFKEGIVHHIGVFTHGEFQSGERVVCKVNEVRRRLHAQLHSAGHLLDFALKNIGKDMKAVKGYHFSDGPYVEYEGVIGEDERTILSGRLEEEMKRLIQSNILVETALVPIENMLQFCDSIPEYLPKDKPARVVSFCFKNGKKGMPCGGTHVQNLQEIGNLTLTKISVKNGNTRISYQIT